jgi:hypothetical protein
VQIEGPAVYLYFEIQDARVFEQALNLLGQCTHGQTKASTAKQAATTEDKVHFGRFANVPVLLIKDDEHRDRCFFSIGDSADSSIRIQVTGADLLALASAFEQVIEELKDAAE